MFQVPKVVPRSLLSSRFVKKTGKTPVEIKVNKEHFVLLQKFLQKPVRSSLSVYLLRKKNEKKTEREKSVHFKSTKYWGRFT